MITIVTERLLIIMLMLMMVLRIMLSMMKMTVIFTMHQILILKSNQSAHTHQSSANLQAMLKDIHSQEGCDERITDELVTHYS